MSFSKGMKIAMLSLHSCPLGMPGTRDTGGMSVYIKQVSRRLGETGIAVDIFTAHYPPEKEPVTFPAEKVRLIHLPPVWPRETGKPGLFPYLRDIALSIEDFRKKEGITYSLIHSHYWLSCLAGQYLSEWWSLPHIVMLHTSARAKNLALGYAAEPHLREESETKILSAASRIVAATEKEKQDLINLYGAHADRITVIPCGVDLELFQPVPIDKARSSLGMDSKRILLYVGRIEAEKGIDRLIEAASLLKNGHNIEVYVVGGGEEDKTKIDSLKMQSDKLGISDITHFQEAVAQSELPLYYSAADLCVLPSRYETFGLVALESLACGTPVVASKVGVMGETVDCKAGVLLDDPNPARLASALSCVLADKALLRGMATRARETVLDLGWDRVAGKIRDLYEKIV